MVGRQSAKRQGKVVWAEEPGKPSRLVVEPLAEQRDRQIVLERIDSNLFGAAELDVIERYFGDLVMQVFDR